MSDQEKNLPSSLPRDKQLSEEQMNEMAAIGGSAFQKTLQAVLSGKVTGGIKGIFKAAMESVEEAEREHRALQGSPEENKKAIEQNISSPNNQEHE